VDRPHGTSTKQPAPLWVGRADVETGHRHRRPAAAPRPPVPDLPASRSGATSARPAHTAMSRWSQRPDRLGHLQDGGEPTTRPRRAEPSWADPVTVPIQFHWPRAFRFADLHQIRDPGFATPTGEEPTCAFVLRLPPFCLRRRALDRPGSRPPHDRARPFRRLLRPSLGVPPVSSRLATSGGVGASGPWRRR
jgi:hypothetical protein